MTKLLGKLKLRQKLVLIIVGSFALPVGILAYFTFQSFEENIDLARPEQSRDDASRGMLTSLDGFKLRSA